MAGDELRRLIESNARAVQAMLNARAEDRLRFQDFQQRMDASALGFQTITVRLANLQKDVDRLLDQHNRAEGA